MAISSSRIYYWHILTLQKLQLFSTNDWPIIMEGVAADFHPTKSSSSAAQGFERFFVYIYFISTYIWINFVCMQMVIAVIVEAYKAIQKSNSSEGQSWKKKSKLNSHTVGRALWIPFSFNNFLENILQRTSFNVNLGSLAFILRFSFHEKFRSSF